MTPFDVLVWALAILGCLVALFVIVCLIVVLVGAVATTRAAVRMQRRVISVTKEARR
jgi:hypothetical protein